ncbi:MAG: methyltransferase [Acidimicrobiia bacterium]|nr:MAG: methyltransferase [Acidimicrobiia bacterium]
MARDRGSPPAGRADRGDDRTSRWSRVADRLDRQLAPVDEPLFDAAALAPGLQVLDVGCGRGSTTRRAAREVTPGGRVVGLDVSDEVVRQARVRTPGSSPIEWMVARAHGAPLPDGRLDRVISRFGCTFFPDAAPGFANLARATRPGGRLCITVWAHRDRSPLHRVPVEAARRAAAALGYDLGLPPPDGGMHSLGSADHAIAVAEGAGWTEVRYTPHELELYVGGPGPLEDAVETRMAAGTVADALEGAPRPVVDAVAAALADAFAPYHDGVGVRMPAAFAVVTARRA